MTISSAAVHRQTEHHKSVEATNETPLFFDKHHDDDFGDIIYPIIAVCWRCRYYFKSECKG